MECNDETGLRLCVSMHCSRNAFNSDYSGIIILGDYVDTRLYGCGVFVVLQMLRIGG